MSRLQDVDGPVLVPAGSLLVVNGTDHPDRLYFMNPAGTGTVLADVPVAGLPQVDEAGGVGIAYHSGRHSLFVVRGNTDVVTELELATGKSTRSFHAGFGVGEGDIAVRPGTGSLLLGTSNGRLVELDTQTGRVIGNYDPIGNSQLGTMDMRQQGIHYQGFAEATGLGFDGSGQLWAATGGGRILMLALPAAPISLQVDGAMAASVDGTPADPLKPGANAGQRIRITAAATTVSPKSNFPVLLATVRRASYVFTRRP